MARTFRKREDHPRGRGSRRHFRPARWPYIITEPIQHTFWMQIGDVEYEVLATLRGRRHTMTHTGNYRYPSRLTG